MDTKAKVYESGYFAAQVKATGYETIENIYVYVRVEGDDSEPPISEFPSIDPVTYHDGITAGELTLNGGKGIVPGHFEISNTDQALKYGNNSIGVVFIPDDSEQKQINLSINVKVAKAEAFFIDENGESYVPELHYSIGEKIYFSRVSGILEDYYPANCGWFKIDSFAKILPLDETRNYYDTSTPGTYDCIANLKSQGNSNYTNTLKFKIIIEKNKINPDIQSQGNNMFAVVDRNIFSSATLTGRFTVEVQGEKGEYAQTITDVKLGVPFEYRPGKSGKYMFTITYDDKNDEKYELPEPVEVSKDIVLSWTVTGKNVHFESRLASYGEEVMVDAAITNDKFGGWKFYDESGKEIKDFNYTETSQNLRITFVMPDYPITVEAVDKTQSGISGGGNFSDCFSNFVKWLNNLAAKLKALFDAIAQLLTVVG